MLNEMIVSPTILELYVYNHHVHMVYNYHLHEQKVNMDQMAHDTARDNNGSIILGAVK